MSGKLISLSEHLSLGRQIKNSHCFFKASVGDVIKSCTIFCAWFSRAFADIKNDTFRTLDLAITQYQKIKKLKLKGEVRSQIERAALSVCLNLSEGSAKMSTNDRRRFFNISYASQKEVQTILLIEDLTQLAKEADFLSASLYQLHQRAY